jgi:hypothetical protein
VLENLTEEFSSSYLQKCGIWYFMEIVRKGFIAFSPPGVHYIEPIILESPERTLFGSKVIES